MIYIKTMLSQKKVSWGNYKLNNASSIYSSNIEQKLIDELRYSIEGRYHGHGLYVDKIINLELGPLSIKTYNQRTNGQMLVDIVYNANVILFNKYNVFEMTIDKIITSDETILASTKYMDKVDVLTYIKQNKENKENKEKYVEGGKIIVVLDAIDAINLKARTISFAGMHFIPENFIRSKLYQKQYTLNIEKLTQEQKDLITHIQNASKDHKVECKAFDRSKESTAIQIAENKQIIFPSAGNDYNDLFTVNFLPSNDASSTTLSPAKSSEFLTLILLQKKYNLTIPTHYFTKL
jgi:hypothetical protein